MDEDKESTGSDQPTVNTSVTEAETHGITLGLEVERSGTLSKEGEEDEEWDRKPLTADEFRDALQRVDALGLTWTDDPIPKLMAKRVGAEERVFSEELERLQNQYPHFPSELGLVVYYALTGTRPPLELVGSVDELNEKAEAVKPILTSEYRSDFFFKRALKVPYLSDIDWEVVIKTAERNVREIPGVTYALLSFNCHNPSVIGQHTHTNLTVAADIKLVKRFIRILNDVRVKLEHSSELIPKLSGSAESTGKKDDRTDSVH